MTMQPGSSPLGQNIAPLPLSPYPDAGHPNPAGGIRRSSASMNAAAESPILSAASSVSPATAQADGAPDRASPASKRFQVPRACDRCKRLRRGCSEYRPCRRCVDSGVADQCQVASASHAGYASGIGIDAQSSHQRLLELIPMRVVDYCAARFFDRLHPTIPILTPEYVARLKANTASVESDKALESLCVLIGMCGQVLLQTEEPEDLFHQGVIPERNLAFGRLLLETAVSTYQTLPRRSPITVELCLSSFFLYACEAVLFHHSRAFRFLRDTTTLLLLRPDESDELERLVAGRLFWVLLVSERSHAIRYRRPITLQITNDTPSLDTRDPALVGFWSLAALFRPIDTSFIAVLNHENTTISPTPESLNNVETKVNSALGAALDLRDTQKTNLRVTQLWLRVIIWQLRLHLGYLVEESYQHSLTFRYPIDVAKDLTLSTRDLPTASFKVHGVGMTEKLFDIASALVDVLARIPITSTSPRGLAMGTLPEDDLSYLRNLIRKLPGGNTIYDDLLEKHIQQTMPSLASARPDVSSMVAINSR